MHISFYPALGTRTRVPVGPNNSGLGRDEDGVRVAYTARLSTQDYEEAMRSDLRVEVWTNAPSGSRPAGEWGPIAFNEVDGTATRLDAREPEPDLTPSSEEQTNTLSSVGAEVSSTHVFRADFTLPRNPGLIFAFTYRLVYPSGICWLGSDRDNGVLELDAGPAFYEENGSWTTEGGSRAYIDNPEGELSAAAENCSVVGKLDVIEWTWSGWATDGSRAWSFNDSSLEPLEAARFAYLIPSAFSNSMVLPQIYVFHTASREARFSITSEGYIVLHPCQEGLNLTYRVHDPNAESDLELLRSEIASSCFALRLLSVQDRDTILFTPNYDDDTSLTVYAQHLTYAQSPERCIPLPITALNAFGNLSDTVSILAPETRETFFVDRSRQTEDLKLRFGHRVAEVVISTVYDLASHSPPHLDWQFSLVGCSAATERVTPSSIEENPLPTPPASPRLKPQRTVSFALPADNDSDSGLRHRKPADPPAPTTDQSSVIRRLLRTDDSFEHFQASPFHGKILTLGTNILKLLARFMGVALLRFVLFAFRLLFGKRKDSRTRSPWGEASADETHESSPPPLPLQGGPESGAGGSTSPSGNKEATASSVGKDPVETPEDHSGRTDSTAVRKEAPGAVDSQERSIPLTPIPKSESPALKWVLPVGDEAPIGLLVRSDVKPEEVMKYLDVELNGGGVEHFSSVNVVGERITMVEIARPEGGTAELLVRLRNCN